MSEYQDSGVKPEDYAMVQQSLEERRTRLVEVAQKSLEAAETEDDEAEVQGVLAGSHRILSRLAPEQAEQVERRAEDLGQKPFFSRFLDSQETPDHPITLKFPSDKEDAPPDRRCVDIVTKKFPSDWEDKTGGEAQQGRPSEWVTLKYPSDNNEIFTLKYPSDSDEPAYG